MLLRTGVNRRVSIADELSLRNTLLFMEQQIIDLLYAAFFLNVRGFYARPFAANPSRVKGETIPIISLYKEQPPVVDKPVGAAKQ
jgi:hypothetical protein